MKAMRLLRLAVAVFATTILVACAHPITIGASEIPQRDESTLIKKRVAYVMTEGDRAKEVTTDGGGGDKVRYLPYRDLEKSFRDSLRAVFEEVTVIRSPSEADASTAYIFAPEITTTSSSPSLLTWPPTRFTVEYACTVTNPKGEMLARVRVSGSGAAEFSEFRDDFGLSGKRAASDAANLLVREIKANQKLR